MALAAYRHLLRSARIAFAGDAPLLTAARDQARSVFQKNEYLEAGGPEAVSAVKHAEEVAQILRQNVVQGKKIEGEDDRYKLRIHKDTERGDNDTVKMPNGKSVVIDGKTCAD